MITPCLIRLPRVARRAKWEAFSEGWWKFNHFNESNMPITKSAKKALKVSKRRHAENLLMKQQIKSTLKGVRLALDAKNKDVSKELSAAYSELDKAAKKNFIHKNKANRLKSRLTIAATKAGAKTDSKLSEKAVKTTTKTKAKAKK